jgi:hypothetical protein
VAESGQFGSGRNRQFGDKTGGGAMEEHCAECEAMLIDALDGVLSKADQARFERHAAGCEPCGQMVADARRGVAWLELLGTSAPEPPAGMLERILAETSWPLCGDVGAVVPAAMHSAGVAAVAGAAMAAGYGPRGSNVVPFPRRAYAAVRRSGFGQIVLQPRLAMTAAMAFFSIALTMNITGIHPASLRASDLEPSSLRRDFFSANARVAQYYEGLRVVYELESRMHDLQSAEDTDAPGDVPAGGDLAPAQPAAQPAAEPGTQPGTVAPKAAPSSEQPSRRQSEGRQHERGTSSSPDPRTSRREGMTQSRSVVVAEDLRPGSLGNGRGTHVQRRLV